MTFDEFDPALVVDGVGRRFGRSWALRDCSFELPDGAVCALVGPNGAGKSTLFMLLTGLLPASEGAVRVLGADPAVVGVPPGVAFVAQHKPLYRRFTVAEMLRAAAAMNARSGWDAEHAARLVEEAGIDPGRRIDALSAGQRTRVALAVALGRRPRLLLLDEPLAELDPLARREVMGTVLAEAVESGMTVLLSSHLVAEQEQGCDHLVLLVDGRVAVDGPMDEVVAEHRRVVAPAGTDPLAGPGGSVVRAVTSGRQTTALVRGPIADVDGLVGEPVALEELVIAHLQQAGSVRTGPTAGVGG